MRRMLSVLAAMVVLGLGLAATGSANAPPGVPGEPGCFGHVHGDIAQDWKAFPDEPHGFSPLVRFFGHTTQEANANIRAEDCAG
jgi:hypothetical protein